MKIATPANTRFIFAFTWLCGILDSLTGLGLTLAPVLTLQAMSLDVSLYPLSLIRFIGAFVFANGSLYLWAAFFARTKRSLEPIRIIWLASAWIRLCVAVVTGALLINGSLEGAWASVPATDASIALLQLAWLKSKYFPAHES